MIKFLIDTPNNTITATLNGRVVYMMRRKNIGKLPMAFLLDISKVLRQCCN